MATNILRSDDLPGPVITLADLLCQSADHDPIEQYHSYHHSLEPSSSNFECSVDSDFSFHNSVVVDQDFPSAGELFCDGQILPAEINKEIPPICSFVTTNSSGLSLRASSIATKIGEIEERKGGINEECANVPSLGHSYSQAQHQPTIPPTLPPLRVYLNDMGSNDRDLGHQEKHHRRKMKTTTSRNEEGLLDNKHLESYSWPRQKSRSFNFSTSDKGILCYNILLLSRSRSVTTARSPPDRNQSREGQKPRKPRTFWNCASTIHKNSLEKNYGCHGIGTLSPHGHSLDVPLGDLFCLSSSVCFSRKNDRNKK